MESLTCSSLEKNNRSGYQVVHCNSTPVASWLSDTGWQSKQATKRQMANRPHEFCCNAKRHLMTSHAARSQAIADATSPKALTTTKKHLHTSSSKQRHPTPPSQHPHTPVLCVVLSLPPISLKAATAQASPSVAAASAAAAGASSAFASFAATASSPSAAVAADDVSALPVLVPLLSRSTDLNMLAVRSATKPLLLPLLPAASSAFSLSPSAAAAAGTAAAGEAAAAAAPAGGDAPGLLQLPGAGEGDRRPTDGWRLGERGGVLPRLGVAVLLDSADEEAWRASLASCWAIRALTPVCVRAEGFGGIFRGLRV